MKNNIFYALIITILLCGQAFGQQTLTLEQSRRLALENNYNVKNSQLEIDAAIQKKKEIFTRFFPNISANSLIYQAQDNLLNISFMGMNMGMMKSGNLGMLSATQPIFAGGRTIYGYQLASLGEDVNKYKDRLSRNDVMLKTEEYYWQVVSLNEKINTLKRYEEFLNRLLKQTEDAYAAGLILKNDVLKVKLKRSEILLNQSKVENGQQIALMAFCQYIGIPYDSSIQLNDSLEIIDSPKVYYINHSDVLKTTYEYKLLESSVTAEELQTKIKLGEYLPQIGVGVGELLMKFDEADSQSTGVIFGTLSMPLSNWWEASHALHERKVREKIAKNNFKNYSELLLLQMQKVWQDLNDSYKQVLLSEDAKVQAQENLKMNQVSYENGMSTLSDLLEAQAMLQQMNDQQIDAKAYYKNKLIVYMQVTGR